MEYFSITDPGKVRERNEDCVTICENGANDSSELAEAIYNSLSAGCDTNGTNTCTYVEPLTGVSYTFNYYTPTNQNIYIKISTGQAVSNEAKEDIKEALLNDFNGLGNNGNAKISIGDSLYASRFYNVGEPKHTQIGLITDSKYALTGEYGEGSINTCLYSGQKNFVELYKGVYRWNKLV